jgi:hypothetical protein
VFTLSFLFNRDKLVIPVIDSDSYGDVKVKNKPIRRSSQGGGSNMMPMKWFQTSKGLIYPGCTGNSKRKIKHFG